MNRVVLLFLLTLALAGANPACAATSGAIGYIDSPAQGATYTRPAGAPHVLIDFISSGQKVWINDAQAFQLFNVQVSFYLELNGALLDADLPPQMIIQCDANGDWEYSAKGTGRLEKLGYGVGPGDHSASIKSDLVVGGNAALNAEYSHAHSFTVK